MPGNEKAGPSLLGGALLIGKISLYFFVERHSRTNAQWSVLQQEEWNAAYYAEILSADGSGLTMTTAECTALARADLAPTDKQLLAMALHTEFLERLEADFWRQESQTG
jgi:hypothetical protein